MSSTSLDTSKWSDDHSTGYQMNKRFAVIISNILSEIMEEEEKLNNNHKFTTINRSVDIFAGKRDPSISIHEYYERLIKYTKLENFTLIISLIYLDRIFEMDNVVIKIINAHRLILASVFLAIKFNEDDLYDNKFYARVGRVKLEELLKIEETYLQKINYSLFVHESIFAKYESFLNEYDGLN